MHLFLFKITQEFKLKFASVKKYEILSSKRINIVIFIIDDMHYIGLGLTRLHANSPTRKRDSPTFMPPKKEENCLRGIYLATAIKTSIFVLVKIKLVLQMKKFNRFILDKL